MRWTGRSWLFLPFCPVLLRHGWMRAEASGNIREAIERIDLHLRAELWVQRIHPAQTVEPRKIAVGRAEV